MSAFIRSLCPVLLVVLCVVEAGCGGTGSRRGLTRQYEYEQDIYLDLDGSASVIVNASIPALIALHGFPLSPEPRARVDRGEIRALFEAPGVDVTRVSRPWRRRGRRYVQVRIETDDIERLSSAPPFAWTRFELTHVDGRATFRGRVGGTARPPVPQANWDGSELVAFKLHLPSRVYFHNVRDLETRGTGAVERGNILRWEQRLADRLAGTPIEMDVRMDSESILNRTLWLFGGAFAGAMALLAALIWWTVRRGRARARGSSQSQPQS